MGRALISFGFLEEEAFKMTLVNLKMSSYVAYDFPLLQASLFPTPNLLPMLLISSKMDCRARAWYSWNNTNYGALSAHCVPGCAFRLSH